MAESIIESKTCLQMHSQSLFELLGIDLNTTKENCCKLTKHLFERLTNSKDSNEHNTINDKYLLVKKMYEISRDFKFYELYKKAIKISNDFGDRTFPISVDTTTVSLYRSLCEYIIKKENYLRDSKNNKHIYRRNVSCYTKDSGVVNILKIHRDYPLEVVVGEIKDKYKMDPHYCNTDEDRKLIYQSNNLNDLFQTVDIHNRWTGFRNGVIDHWFDVFVKSEYIKQAYPHCAFIHTLVYIDKEWIEDEMRDIRGGNLFDLLDPDLDVSNKLRMNLVCDISRVLYNTDQSDQKEQWIHKMKDMLFDSKLTKLINDLNKTLEILGDETYEQMGPLTYNNIYSDLCQCIAKDNYIKNDSTNQGVYRLNKCTYPKDSGLVHLEMVEPKGTFEDMLYDIKKRHNVISNYSTKQADQNFLKEKAALRVLRTNQECIGYSDGVVHLWRRIFVKIKDVKDELGSLYITNYRAAKWMENDHRCDRSGDEIEIFEQNSIPKKRKSNGHITKSKAGNMKNTKQKKQPACYVYTATSETINHIKIGMTSDPVQRRLVLRTSMPNIQFCAFRYENAAELEKATLKEFYDWIVEGENLKKKSKTEDGITRVQIHEFYEKMGAEFTE